MKQKLRGSSRHRNRSLRINSKTREHEENQTTFDARDKWSHCPSISRTYGKGVCSSCWAVVVAEVLTDRSCIKSNGRNTFNYSARNLATCCKDCGNITVGGFPHKAFAYWKTTGIVSEECQPYNVSDMDCQYGKDISKCETECVKESKRTYEDDLRRGNEFYKFCGTTDIQREIVSNGPVAAGTWADLPKPCTKRIHSCHGPRQKLDHAVRIIGWGTEKEKDYWLVASSHRNEGNICKIERGKCGIESYVYSGKD
ncbi:hypothetical protein SK128_010838 [Halocaridina rubra]|uniref:Peptidase C1A papain C-terminal domain-containing protein n=1 Tax=Halocaridina rubra TaxID=373956 RepID=A0AAN8XL68_HALRR